MKEDVESETEGNYKQGVPGQKPEERLHNLNQRQFINWEYQASQKPEEGLHNLNQRQL